MLTRAEKESQVADLREKFERASTVIVADYRGTGVLAANELRRGIRAQGEGKYEYRVSKNTLLRRAVEGTDVASLVASFKGPTAIAISYGDPVGLAKLLVDHAKNHEVFELKAGWIDGQTIDCAEIEALAKLPSLEELRGQLVGLLLAPATKIARVLSAPGAQLARLMEARRAKLEEAGGAD